MMMLSTEQTRAAMHGIANELTWHEIERPIGPQPIPAWCKGAHVDWHNGYANSPSIRLKVIGDVREWEGKTFRQESSRYIAEHADGRAEQYAHNGPVALRPVRLFRRPDGSLHRNIRSGPEWYEPRDGVTCWPPHGYEPGEWIDAERLATTQQGGFGGSTIWVTMIDGREIALRGPWHVGAPAGFAEVAYVDATDAYYRRSSHKRPWHDRGGRAGLYLREDVFVRILSRFLPHLPIASVTYGGCTTLEPFKAEWGEPKRLVYERQWQAAKVERDAKALTASERELLAWLSKEDFSQYGECHGAALDRLVKFGFAVISEGRAHQSGFIAQGDHAMYRAVSLTEGGLTALKLVQSA